MTTPIIDPSTLSEEQREAIKEEYNGWTVFLNTRDESAAKFAIAAIEEIFGSEFFANQKKNDDDESEPKKHCSSI